MGRPPFFPPEVASELSAKYLGGESICMLATERGATYNAVRNALLRCGTALRPPHATLSRRGGTARGSTNGSWSGDQASYNTRHQRVKRARGKANGPCSHCHTMEAVYRFEWAQLHGTTGLNPQDYIALCRLCHEEYDARAISREQVQEIKALKFFGISKGRLAEMYGITEHYVYCITSGRSRKAPVPHCEMG